jgi:hypothetical protein
VANNSADKEEPKADVYEEDDTPHPIGHADVAHWLQLSDATHINIAALPTSAAPVRRGVYHSTQVGKEISLRRAQEMRKVERERERPRKNRRRICGVDSSQVV